MFREEQHDTPLGSLNVAIGPNHGPPLVCLHGVTRRWQCLLPVMETLANRWHVHGVDMPGHGGSRAHCEPFTVLRYADALQGWLTSRFAEPVVLYGHSLGAMVAADLAGREPASVAAVILEDPPFHTMGERIGNTPLLSYFSGVAEYVANKPADAGSGGRRLSRLGITDPHTGSVTRLGETRGPAALRFMASCLADVAPAVLSPIVAQQWLDGYDVSQVARRLQAPTLLIQADTRQGGMLTDDDATMFIGHTADVIRVRQPGVGHQMHWADPGWLTREATLFLESLPHASFRPTSERPSP
jgi:pimeloyl-ACP methyl ester carboxylesterase